jgi:beta-lactam-binding protein with PASTA domain
MNIGFTAMTPTKVSGASRASADGDLIHIEERRMSFNRRPTECSQRGIAKVAASLLAGLLTIVMPAQAQAQTFQGPVCAVPPMSQDNDGWPYAGSDSLGNAAGPISFAGSFLLANDRGTTLSVASVASMSSAGGTISGTDPYTYTPPATTTVPATPSDVFTYEIRDSTGQTAVGIVKVGLIADIVNPSVNISAPAADSTVSGNVSIQAAASDNVGVVRVQFFVDDVEIGNDVTTPFSISWDSRTVADGIHTISALARDAAGNPGASSGVGVKVLNAAAMVSVPTVVGLTQTAAQTAITSAGLTVGALTPASSATVPAGQVISQAPTAGVSVALGSAVSLSVSSGPAMAAVPGVIGKTQAAAQSAISAAGFTSAMTTANSATVAAGSVISQNPTAGTSAVVGSAVSFVVSLGPATAAVPGVVGMTQAAAQSAISTAGFTSAATTANSASVVAGSVISQNPTAGTNAVVGSSVAIVVSLGPAVTPPPPANGLVLALGFDEASGTVATDSSASAKSGAIRQAVRVPGKFGGALKFDGVDDWVTVTDTTASPLDLSTGMTLEAWVNPSSLSGWECVLMKERGVVGEGLLSYALYAHDGAPLSMGQAVPAGYVRLNNATLTSDKAVRGTTKVPLNTWTHIATTYDGVVQKFYVNGVLVGTANPIVAPSLNTIVQSNGALRIGGDASSTGEFFNGLIDEVRVYNRALSATEITTDMSTAIVR